MRHHYDECNLCHETDENQELKMFTYDTSRKDRYIISQAAYTDDDDATYICIKCIRTIKEFDEGMVR